MLVLSRVCLKCDGTRAETRFRLSAKWTSPFKSAGAPVHSSTDSRGVRISGSNAGYTMFRGSVKGTSCPHHSFSPSLSLPCVTVCHHISTGLYFVITERKYVKLSELCDTAPHCDEVITWPEVHNDSRGGSCNVKERRGVVLGLLMGVLYSVMIQRLGARIGKLPSSWRMWQRNF